MNLKNQFEHYKEKQKRITITTAAAQNNGILQNVICVHAGDDFAEVSESKGKTIVVVYSSIILVQEKES